jgi:hypothetical protein
MTGRTTWGRNKEGGSLEERKDGGMISRIKTEEKHI